MAKAKFPVTPAVRQLRQAGVDFSAHLYDYQERGGAPHAARELGLDLHRTVKTLVFADGQNQSLLVLMHGDREVSAKAVARQLGLKSLAPCTPEAAHRHTGYQVGGISPFGTRKPLPVCCEATILDLDRIYINGGKRGFLVGLAPGVLDDLLRPTLVSAALDDRQGDTPR